MKYFLNFLVLIFSINYIYSQSNLLNAKTPSEIEKLDSESNKSVFLEYDEIDQKDVLWSKVVYEYIDLNEKLNYPLLFPIKDNVYRNSRKSLWKTILDEIKKGTITELYKADDDQFKEEYKATDDPLTDKNEVLSLYMDDSGTFLGSENIRGYNIKGIWYFDKVHSQLKYRLLAIQAVGDEIKSIKSSLRRKEEVPKTEYHWIWYPSIRGILHNSKVFNDKNNNNSISFDDLLINRRFNSYIYKYDNVYGNRKISDYIKKRDGESDNQFRLRMILESERIKNEILNFELDMWGY